MAADIEKGEPVLLNSGYLADAMRASMSIPTLFTPIEIDNKMLVDGGLFNNYPADIMKKQGADIIIGVDVQRTLFTKKELHSIKRVVEQMGNFLRNQSNLDNRKVTDYLIQPDVKQYTITDFDKADSIIESGERAARKMLPSLLKLVDSLNKIGPAPKKIPLAVMSDQLIIKAIKYEGLKNVPERVVENRLDIYVGDTVSIDDLSKAIDRTYASQYFDIVTYKLEPKDDGVCLVVRVIEKDYGLVKMGIHYDNDFEASLLFNAVFRNLLINGSKLTVDLGLGRNPRFSFQYYLNNGRWPNVGTSVKTNTLDVYNYDPDGNKTASYRYSEMLVDLFAETIISNSMTFGMGGQFEMSSLRKAVSPFQLGNIEQAFFNLYAYYKVDTYDRAFYPRKGGSLWIEGKLIYGINKAVSDYDAATLLTLRYRNAFKINNKFSIIPSVNIGTAIADSLPLQHRYLIGGANFGDSRQLFPFIGMNLMQHSDYSAVVLGCDLQYEFHKNHFLVLKYSIGKTARKAQSLLDMSSDYQGIGLTYGYNSPIGPIELTLMVSNDTNKVLSFINLGYWF
jgi:NTE family protein